MCIISVECRKMMRWRDKIMRTIAILKKCLDNEKEIILSVTRKEDKVLFYDNE